MAKVTLAKTAGFCYGVQRAVDIIEQLLADGISVTTYGELIHNPQVMEKYISQGVQIIEDISNFNTHRTVLIRAHGVGQNIYDYLDNNNISYKDATCPHVSKIQEIVKKATLNNEGVLIAGDCNHPEIIGIIGHCAKNSQIITFSNYERFIEKLNNGEIYVKKSYILVAQTTFNMMEWRKCVEVVKKMYTNIRIFDTICNATMLRQSEAVELAKKSDTMIVVGGRGSSNTAKLVQICNSHCHTVLIEQASELPAEIFSAARIGVTAGASTPAFIIKEVQKIMSETKDMQQDNDIQDEMSFEEMLELSFKTINSRERVTAIVTGVSPNEISVDIGTKHAGYVQLNEFTDDPNAKLEDLVKVGDEIELIVLRVSDVDGTASLSKKRLDSIAGFDKIIEAETSGAILEGTVVEVVKGGVIALTTGVRVFIPASQATLSKNQELESLLKQKVNFKILETNKPRRRAVASIRAVLKEQRKVLEDQFWADVQADKTYSGVVKSLTSYGAFVDLGGVDGMVHISELSWKRIKHPSEVVSVDDVIEVYVREIDAEKRKISLGFKKVDENPWEVLAKDYQTGSIVDAKIVSMTPFGAFAQIIPGVDGLIHISQVSSERIGKPSDVLSIGQDVKVKITEIDFDKKRVSLSIRALVEDEAEKVAAEQEAAPALVYEAAPPEETK